MKTIPAADVWENYFVPELHKKFLKEVPSYKKFEDLIKSHGGAIHLDHGATRTADPKVHEFLTRLANAFGLEVSAHYEFPKKHLKAVALQFPDKNGFKWFSTLVLYKEFSDQAIQVVEEDMARTNHVLSDEGMAMLEKMEKTGGLDESEADAFAKELAWAFFTRQGTPVKRNTAEVLAKESQEIVNALLNGIDFNHIGYDLNQLNIKDWYGQEVIEVLNDRMLAEGFEMLPEIQGVPGGILRQTSTKADVMAFPVEEDDGSIGEVTWPSKFVELIQRGAERSEDGKVIFDESGKIKRFLGFIIGNTEKLYDATKAK